MHCLLCLLVGVLSGYVLGGRSALRSARHWDFDAACRRLRRSRYMAFAGAVLATMLLLHWPYRPVAVSVPEEVARTIVEVVQVPVEVTRWFFFTQTEFERQEVQKEIVETVYREASIEAFAPSLLIPMALVGVAAAWCETRFLRLCWQIFD